MALSGATSTAADASARLTVSWRGAYPALLKTIDELVTSAPLLVLARLEMRRTADTAEVEAVATFRLGQGRVAAGR